MTAYAASLVIVTHSATDALKAALTSLAVQSLPTFETLVVDNTPGAGGCPGGYSCQYIALGENRGVCAARNVGIERARSDIVVFIDDDATVAPDFVAQHVHAHRTLDIVGLRGRCLAKTASPYNQFAAHYDLGDWVMPWCINLEGNSSFRRSFLVNAGGFHENIWGHEGIELTRRGVRLHGRQRFVYCPSAVIYHDYADSYLSYAAKVQRHHTVWAELVRRDPELLAFAKSYRRASGRDDLWAAVSI